MASDHIAWRGCGPSAQPIRWQPLALRHGMRPGPTVVTSQVLSGPVPSGELPGPRRRRSGSALAGSPVPADPGGGYGPLLASRSFRSPPGQAPRSASPVGGREGRNQTMYIGMGTIVIIVIIVLVILLLRRRF